jgi:hypothetical protein
LQEYNLKVVIAENNASFKEIENKISDFQHVFTNVASRYYSEKNREDWNRTS